MLVDCVVVVQDWYRLPELGSDDPVAVPHPDALPDALLDLVVVRVGRHKVLVQGAEVVAVQLLGLGEITVGHGLLGLGADHVRFANLLQRLFNTQYHK